MRLALTLSEARGQGEARLHVGRVAKPRERRQATVTYAMASMMAFSVGLGRIARVVFAVSGR